MRRIAVTGASAGIGAALVRALVARGDQVTGIARRPSAAGQWIAGDLADPADIARIAGALGKDPLDAIIHNAGIWEDTAFSDAYDFANCPADETLRVVAINLLAPILLTQALLGPLTAARGRVVLIGSTSGLDNIGTPEVAYNASKAGLRGAAQAMAVALAPRGIAVTLINPGDVDTDPDGRPPRLTLEDLTASVLHCLSLSSGTVINEMTLRPGPA